MEEARAARRPPVQIGKWVHSIPVSIHIFADSIIWNAWVPRIYISSAQGSGKLVEASLSQSPSLKYPRNAKLPRPRNSL